MHVIESVDLCVSGTVCKRKREKGRREGSKIAQEIFALERIFCMRSTISLEEKNLKVN